MRLKYRMRMQWQVTKKTNSESRGQPPQRSVTGRLKGWKNYQWNASLETHDLEDE